ncbi:sodium/calcium exchanger 3-like [Gordionus sp. m RMFG-2023]|uniref:sodium/calcium exchanger 3-like n=1 Tax=Gordionus sp. m RMFG-2023 TaxID=3053472 RepID=UPI0031FCA6AF
MIGRGLVYLLSLIYLFIGVSIVSDRFMSAIEVITSKEKEVAIKRSVRNLEAFGVPSTQEITIITVRIWNETVSNLTLMALGTSAPEILLSIIEVIGKNFEAGELGPGTIIGSAAFNMFVIVGICILVVPSSQLRKIHYLRVFFITASWSIFAYIWLYLILAVISPGVVSVTEALITFFFFPLTVLTAYMVDVELYKRWYMVPKRYDAKYKKSVVYIPDEEALEMESLAPADKGKPSVINGESQMLMPPKYDIGGKRKISVYMDGTSKIIPVYETTDRLGLGTEKINQRPSISYLASSKRKSTLPNFRALSFLKRVSEDIPLSPDIALIGNSVSNLFDENAYRDYVEFEKTRQDYMKALSRARKINPDADLQTLERMASYNFLNRSPKSRAYYRIQATRKLLSNQDNVMSKSKFNKRSIHLFSDKKGPDLKIKPPIVQEDGGAGEDSGKDKLSDQNVTRVYFEPGHYTVMENVGESQIRVVRSGGELNSIIKVDYNTRDGTAKTGEDYEFTKGTLIFEKGMVEAIFSVPIINDEIYEEDKYFYVDLKHLRQKTYAIIDSPSSNPSLTISPTILKLDNPRTATVMILDDNHGGVFSIENDLYKVNEDCGALSVRVVRKIGSRGKVYLPYRTVDGTAKGEAGASTSEEEGREEPFNDNKSQQNLSQPLLPSIQITEVLEDGDKISRISQNSTKNGNIIVEEEEHGSGDPKDFERTKGYLFFEDDQNEPGISVARGMEAFGWMHPYPSANLFSKNPDYTNGILMIFDIDYYRSYIFIRINDTEQYEKSVSFELKLGQPIWAKRDLDENAINDPNSIISKSPTPSMFNDKADSSQPGSPVLGDPSSCIINITESKDFKVMDNLNHDYAKIIDLLAPRLSVDRLLKNINISFMVGTSTWKDQFLEAITISKPEVTENGEEKEGTGKRTAPSYWDYCLHYITLFWKVLFAFVPPTDFWGGWLCFIFAIIWIGILTAVIGDIASAFGCTIGLKDTVTAISFVALGTSVPDTFASKLAALQDEYADASIGNVTGSNAVNVFLGIGLAWALAAIYHSAKGTLFMVDPGSLAFSVTIYCVLAVVAIAVLMVKRSITKGELGGPMMCKVITGCIFFTFWLIYLVLASLESYCHIKGF